MAKSVSSIARALIDRHSCLGEVNFDHVASFIAPGAGLRDLDLALNSDFIFNDIFSTEQIDSTQAIQINEDVSTLGAESKAKPCSHILRAYGSDLDMYVVRTRFLIDLTLAYTAFIAAAN